MENLSVQKVSFKALGTSVEIRIIVGGEDEKERAEKSLKEARSEYARLQKIFDRFDKDSELSLHNARLGEFLTPSPEMAEVAFGALKYFKKTEGYFDPRIIGILEDNGYYQDFKKIALSEISPGGHGNTLQGSLSKDLEVSDGRVRFGVRMDFSGVVKGYITDCVAKMFLRQGWKNFTLDSGGDIFYAGTEESGGAWKVGLEGISYEKIMLELSDCAVATSGISRRKWEKDGRRFHHLINPKDPQNFSFDLKSVTVVADSVEEADVWAKTLYLMGAEHGKIYAEQHGIPCAMLYYKGSAWISPAMQKYTYGKNNQTERQI